MVDLEDLFLCIRAKCGGKASDTFIDSEGTENQSYNRVWIIGRSIAKRFATIVGSLSKLLK